MTQTSFFSLRCTVFTLLVVTISFLCTPGILAQANDSEGAIEQMMSPEEFKAAGLDKLSSKELKNLNAWLRGDREKVLKKAAAREARIQKELIVSRVDGVFNGASTGTIIPLEDGTSWKLANAGEHYFLICMLENAGGLADVIPHRYSLTTDGRLAHGFDGLAEAGAEAA
jgi:hypothetical protein